MKLFFIAVSTLSGSLAFAIAPGLNTDLNTSDYGYLGTVNGASGVLVGSDLVLTAKHLGVSNGSIFSLPGGSSFGIVAGSVINHPTDDLTLFRINGTTSSFANVDLSTVNAGTSVTMVGFGGSGTLNSAGNGYDINIGAGVRRKGTAIVEGSVFVTDNGTNLGWSLVAPLRSNGQAALVGGDSGGGWFRGSSNNLVGINSWIGSFGAGVDYRFSNSNTDFFASGGIELSRYSTWLTTNGVSAVPEPASCLVLTLGALVMLRKKKKS
jgi:hypothetical protein